MNAKDPEPKVQHFTWPDILVIAGGLLILPVAIYERNWFFLSIGLALIAAIGVRVWVTVWLEQRAAPPKSKQPESTSPDDENMDSVD